MKNFVRTKTQTGRTLSCMAYWHPFCQVLGNWPAPTTRTPMVIRSILHILWSGIVAGNELFPVGRLRFFAGPLLICSGGVDRDWNLVMFSKTVSLHVIGM